MNIVNIEPNRPVPYTTRHRRAGAQANVTADNTCGCVGRLRLWGGCGEAVGKLWEGSGCATVELRAKVEEQLLPRERSGFACGVQLADAAHAGVRRLRL